METVTTSLYLMVLLPFIGCKPHYKEFNCLVIAINPALYPYGYYALLQSQQGRIPQQFLLMILPVIIQCLTKLTPGACQDVTIGPGDYVVTQLGLMVGVSGDCNFGPEPNQASGSIQVGETQVCTFFSTQCCSASLSSKDERSYS